MSEHSVENDALAGRLDAALVAAFSGDDYEENAADAAGEHEWSWWKWLARETVRAELARVIPPEVGDA